MSEKEEKQEEYEYIKVIGNEIYFYCDVDSDSVLELNTCLKKLEKELRIKYIELGLDLQPELKLFIHSDGGELYSGLSAMDHIRTTKCKVTTIADGCCASAAAMMFLGGHRRLIKRNAYVLIHQLSTDGVWGKFEEMKDEMENCNKLMEHMKRIVTEVTTIPENKIKRIMKHDLILPPEKCIKYGVASDYYDSEI
jgi:ATP-dependent protease ClpP protease subunit